MLHLFRRRPRPEDSARAAELEAQAAEAKQRAARALVDAEKAKADLDAVRERAATAARERALRAAVRLGPLEAEAEQLAAVRLEAERTRTIAARAANDAAEAKRRRNEAAQRERAVRELIRRRLVATAFAGVSLVAFGGQAASYAIGANWFAPAAIGVALVVEAIALALGWLAHEAKLDDDPAGGLQVGSYLVAGYVAMLNYWHWSGPDWSPTPEAALFAGCSAVAPWLLHAYTQRTYAAKRRAEGNPLERAPRFSRLSWLLWFRPTFGAFRHAVRTGESDPHAAAIAYEQHLAERAAAAAADAGPPRAELEQALASARAELAELAEAHVSLLQAHEAKRAALEANADPNEANADPHEANGDPNEANGDPHNELFVLPEVPPADAQEAMSPAELAEAAHRTVRAAKLAKLPITGRMLGDAYNRGERWGQLRISEVGPFVVAGSVNGSGVNGNGKHRGGE